MVSPLENPPVEGPPLSTGSQIRLSRASNAAHFVFRPTPGLPGHWTVTLTALLKAPSWANGIWYVVCEDRHANPSKKASKLTLKICFNATNSLTLMFSRFVSIFA